MTKFEQNIQNDILLSTKMEMVQFNINLLIFSFNFQFVINVVPEIKSRRKYFVSWKTKICSPTSTKLFKIQNKVKRWTEKIRDSLIQQH